MYAIGVGNILFSVRHARKAQAQRQQGAAQALRGRYQTANQIKAQCGLPVVWICCIFSGNPAYGKRRVFCQINHGCFSVARFSNIAPDQLECGFNHPFQVFILSQQDTATPNFETALAELEALVERMESGDMTLEDSLLAFERGVKLTHQCQDALAQAEQKVAILSQNTPDAALEPFDREH